MSRGRRLPLQLERDCQIACIGAELTWERREAMVAPVIFWLRYLEVAMMMTIKITMPPPTTNEIKHSSNAEGFFSAEGVFIAFTSFVEVETAITRHKTPRPILNPPSI